MAEIQLDFVMELLKKRVRANFDAHVIIDGGTGIGKSTLGVHLARGCDESFTFEKGSFYKNNGLRAAIHDEEQIPKYSVLLVDEAINILYRRDAMRKENKMMNKLIALCRKRNLILLWCVPSFNTLDTQFVNEHVHMRLFVFERGRAQLWMPLKGQHFANIGDPWMRKYNSRNHVGWRYTSSKNYKGEIVFPPLDPEVEKEYLRVCKLKGAGSEEYDSDNKKEKFCPSCKKKFGGKNET